MFIDKAELDRRKQEENNLTIRMKIPPASGVDGKVAELDTTKFKANGTARKDNNIIMPPDLRALVAATAIVAGPEVAAEIGECSPGYAAVLARGEYSQASDPEEREKRNQELRDSIYESLGKIRARAQHKLFKVLKLINDESLAAIPDKDKARLAAQMANQLSGVIDRTINKGDPGSGERTSHLHLYAPEQRPLAAFDIKRVNQLPDVDANAKSVSE